MTNVEVENVALQMTCPFCKQEFPYDNGALDREISSLGVRIATINKRLSDIKNGNHNWETGEERKRLVSELGRKRERLTQLKALRKVCDQQIKRLEYQSFKNIVKERYGEEAYYSIVAEVDEELKAYRVSDTMKHDFSIAPGRKPVTTINKIR